MKFRFTKVIGQTTFTFEDECKTPSEFFQKVVFYQQLPSVGPKGETDLILQHRKPKGFDYYSIESPKAGMEFMFGAIKDEQGVLYPKGWKQIQRGNKDEEPQF